MVQHFKAHWHSPANFPPVRYWLGQTVQGMSGPIQLASPIPVSCPRRQVERISLSPSSRIARRQLLVQPSLGGRQFVFKLWMLVAAFTCRSVNSRSCAAK